MRPPWGISTAAEMDEKTRYNLSSSGDSNADADGGETDADETDADETEDSNNPLNSPHPL